LAFNYLRKSNGIKVFFS